MAGGWPRALDDRYTLLRPLSDGAAARVYAARDRKHDRDVAVKILRVDAASESVVPRFLREVQIAARLSHPHILPLFESGEVEGAPYFVMPLVEGATLRRRLEDEGVLPLAVALSIARQVAAALDYAHQRGVVHRDIKPENILLEGRDARVTDFGIAAAIGVAPDDRITLSGMVVGTPRYMSPEQASGDEGIDQRTDIYSLGIVLFEMLTGEVPYPSVTSLAAWTAGRKPPSARERHPEIPAETDAAIAAAIERDPERRTASARAFIDSLADPGNPPLTPPEKHAANPRPRVRGHVGLAVLMGLGLLLALGWYQGSRRPDLPAARRWVLVAEFDAAAGDAEQALAMRELATTELAQSPAFSIVPSEHIATARRNAGIADSVPMSGAVARELAMRSAVRVVVEGAIRRFGADQWTLTMRAVNAEDGNVLYAESAEASDATLVRALGALVRSVRSGLGERPEALEADRPLQDVSTASFPAFLRYQDALQRSRVADYDGAVHLAHQAIALDSGFASAWVLLANLYVSLQRADSLAWAFVRAKALPDRLSDADRDRLGGDIAFYLDSDPEEAVRAYDRFLLRRPASLSGHNNRALFLSALGRHADALAGFHEAMRVDPLQVGPRNIQLLNIATELTVIGELDSAARVARVLEGAHAQYARMLRLNAAGHWDSLARAARAVLEAPAPPRFAAFPAILHEVGALEALGRTAEATARIEAALARADGSDARWLSHARLLLDAARNETPSWALPASVRDGAGGSECLLRGLHAVQRGAVRAARAEQACLSARAPREQRALGYGPRYLEAWIAMAEGAPSRAASLLREPAAAGEHHPFSVDRVGTIALRLLEARALEASGRADDADWALAAAQQARGLAPNHMPLRGMAARAVLRPPRANAPAATGGH